MENIINQSRESVKDAIKTIQNSLKHTLIYKSFLEKTLKCWEDFDEGLKEIEKQNNAKT